MQVPRRHIPRLLIARVCVCCCGYVCGWARSPLMCARSPCAVGVQGVTSALFVIVACAYARQADVAQAAHPASGAVTRVTAPPCIAAAVGRGDATGVCAGRPRLRRHDAGPWKRVIGDCVFLWKEWVWLGSRRPPRLRLRLQRLCRCLVRHFVVLARV